MSDEANIRKAIEPRSDQLNGDDLVNTTKDITVTSVKRGNAEQPVVIHYEGEDGRPYKPCKSMCRVLAWAWGEDARQWAGRRMRLYQDPEVKFGGVKVGGIRISHISDIERETDFSLTVTRGKKASYIVKPMPAPEPAKQDEPPAKRKARELWAAIGKCETVEQLDALQTAQTNGKHLDAIEQADPAAHGHIIKRFADRRKELQEAQSDA